MEIISYNGKKCTKDELQLKEKGYESLYHFTKYILGYKDLVYRVHKPLCDFIQNNGKDGNTLLDLEPRDTFKTTCGSIGFSIWSIINNYDIRINLNHKILGKVREKLVEIKGHFESNKLFRHLYGDFVSEQN